LQQQQRLSGHDLFDHQQQQFLWLPWPLQLFSVRNHSQYRIENMTMSQIMTKSIHHLLLI
jgi:hypothetical protein